MRIGYLRVAAMLAIGVYPVGGAAQVDGGAATSAWHLARRGSAPPTPDSVLVIARAELELERPEQASELLRALGPEALDRPDVAEVLGAAELEIGNALEAARLFERAARWTDGEMAGTLWARAGDAYERDGDTTAARAAYQEASKALGAIRGWVAIRQARLEPSPLRAFEMLRTAPPASRPLASAVKAALYLEHADSVRAISAFAQAGDRVTAANIALELGDTDHARQLLYRALSATDTGQTRAAARTIVDRFPPQDAGELVRIVHVVRAFDAREAAALLRNAVAGGDSTPRVLRLLGDLEAALGRPTAALAIYDEIGRGVGSESALAQYRRARLLVTIGRTSQGYRALEEFARRHPEASQAPIAAYLVAERAVRRGMRPAAESLLTWVASNWSRHTYGSRARIQAAALALRNHDTQGALGWYQTEMAQRGEQRFAARFFTAQTRMALGDSAGARAHWMRLVREDSLGYYGMVAREMAGMPDVVVAQPQLPRPRLSLAGAFRALELLRRAGFNTEVRTLVDYLVGHVTDPEETLELAEGLSARGWVVEGIRLGWRVAATRSLNDPRVLRVIYPYPWPVRTLIENEAIEHGVDPYLLAAVVRQESAFREAVISRAGARGLMQLMPSTAVRVARRLGVEWEQDWLSVADANLHLGSAHLASLLRQYQRVAPALAAYNAGGTPVARWLRHPDANDPYQFIEQIPYRETRGYVRAVVRYHSLYRALYPPMSRAVTDNP